MKALETKKKEMAEKTYRSPKEVLKREGLKSKTYKDKEGKSFSGWSK